MAEEGEARAAEAGRRKRGTDAAPSQLEKKPPQRRVTDDAGWQEAKSSEKAKEKH